MAIGLRRRFSITMAPVARFIAAPIEPSERAAVICISTLFRFAPIVMNLSFCPRICTSDFAIVFAGPICPALAYFLISFWHFASSRSILRTSRSSCGVRERRGCVGGGEKAVVVGGRT